LAPAEPYAYRRRRGAAVRARSPGWARVALARGRGRGLPAHGGAHPRDSRRRSRLAHRVGPHQPGGRGRVPGRQPRRGPAAHGNPGGTLRLDPRTVRGPRRSLAERPQHHPPAVPARRPHLERGPRAGDVGVGEPRLPRARRSRDRVRRLPGGLPAALRARTRYRTDVRDDIFFIASSVTGGYFQNIRATRRSGFELALQWLGPAGLRLYANYGYTTATFETTARLATTRDPNGETIEPGDALPLVPNHRVNVGAGLPVFTPAGGPPLRP